MALIQANIISLSLMRTVTIQVILPADKPVRPGQEDTRPATYKTLYLLHGIIGNYTDWVTGTNIQRLAEDLNLAVVMPCGDNSFYLDQPGSFNYGEFVGKELVETTRRLFPLSHRREDTFIAGLSMGGFGAFRNGLKYHETFSHIAGLSNALVTYGIEECDNSSPMIFEQRDYFERIFGDLSTVNQSDRSPIWIARQLKAQNIPLPNMFIACGKDDFLLELNRKFRDELLELNANLHYEEGPGSHEWDFWNRYIAKVLEWLPLEEEAAPGISSGNIGK